MDIKVVIHKSLELAAANPDDGKDRQAINRNRSKNFVEKLAFSLREEFETRPTVRVFSRDCDKHRSEFGLNELLFDVLVCDTNKVRSATGSAQLSHVTAGLWAIESEMARNTRAAVYDFNKLVLAASKYLLFVGPQVADERSFLAPMLQPAGFCHGTVFVALIPHPDVWNSSPLTVHLWEFAGDQWLPR